MATFLQRPNGRWQAKVRRHGLPPLSQVFDRKIDAAAWARAQESEFERGVWRDRSVADATTLFQLLEHYQQDVAPTKRGADVEVLRIRTIQRDPLSRFKLTALTPSVLAGWRDDRLAGGAAGSTVNRELNLLSAVINWARKELMMPIDNPVSAIRRPPQGQARERRLQDGEEARLMRALGDHAAPVKGQKRAGNYRIGARNFWIKPMVQFALETAMRRGELLSLQWADVDLKDQTAFLQQTKNGESRTVPLSSRAVAILRALPRSLDGRVFPTTADALKKVWQRACTQADLEDLRFHDLRHEATSRLAEKLPNVIELAAVTGHRDLRMLKRYYHPRATDLAKKLG